MPKRNEYVEFLLEQLQPFGPVSARAMFGGHGIYKDGAIFGIVADDTFYLKVDDVNRGEFEARKLSPFTYESTTRGTQLSMNYYQCPADALESPALMLEWARSGYAAALRAAARKTSKAPRKKSTVARGKPRSLKG